MMRSLICLCTLAATAAASATTNGIKTNFPVIAIMAHRHAEPHNPRCGSDCDTIEASYVKWVESAGGRAVAIPNFAFVFTTCLLAPNLLCIPSIPSKPHGRLGP